MPRIALGGVSLLPEDAQAALEFAVANGYQALELYGDFPQAHFEDLDGAARKRLRRVAEERGVSIAVHAPWIDLNIASFNRGVRAESVRQHKGTIDMAADLGAELVVVHAGGVSGRVEAARELCFDFALYSMMEIAEHAAVRGMLLCLENVLFEGSAIDSTYQDLLTIKERVASSCLKFAFDFGHARLKGGIGEGLKRLGEDIHHIHLSENGGERDDHRLIGSGDMDYSPYLDFLKSFEGMIVLEVMGLVADGRDRALQSREHVLRLLREGRGV